MTTDDRAAALARVPEHLRGGLTRYLEQHIRTGSFLAAVLRNDLADAVGLGQVSMAGLSALVRFLVYFAPPQAWGSPERVHAWLAPGGLVTYAGRTELEDRLQDLAHRLTAERDQLRAMLLSADEADALLDLIIESDHPATEPWGTIADKLVAQRDRRQGHTQREDA
jgi:hypothetical protein